MTPHILTVEQAAEYLQVSRRTLYTLMTHDGLPSYKVGPARRLRRSAIDSWLNGKLAKPQSTRRTRRTRKTA